jgi:hypothetical protein
LGHIFSFSSFIRCNNIFEMFLLIRYSGLLIFYKILVDLHSTILMCFTIISFSSKYFLTCLLISSLIFELYRSVLIYRCLEISQSLLVIFYLVIFYCIVYLIVFNLLNFIYLIYMTSVLLNLLRLVYGPKFALLWYMCIQLLLGRVFSECQLGQVVWWCCSKSIYLLTSHPFVLLTIERGYWNFAYNFEFFYFSFPFHQCLFTIFWNYFLLYMLIFIMSYRWQDPFENMKLLPLP